MSKLQELGQPDDGQPKRLEFFFWCEGCEMRHMIRAQGPHPCWDWNRSLEAPTFSPSYLIRAMENVTQCHSFIQHGKIQYLSDCDHPLKGETVDLKDVELWRDE